MRAITFLLFCCLASNLFAQDAQARKIHQRSLAAIPTSSQLKFFQLDWAESFEQARERARQEHRPIALFWITNITAGCNFFTGHT
ncbi:MAG: hypothetical protein JNJ77_10845 [Planctomycetia bacterium]|nr:hypothetical protein [Planctomycetia bacterium]